MTQPNAAPVEDYEYGVSEVAVLMAAGLFFPRRRPRSADETDSYESLPPNFSLLQNMAAGAFAGIAEHCTSKFRAPRSLPFIGTWGSVSRASSTDDTDQGAVYPIDAIKVSAARLSPCTPPYRQTLPIGKQAGGR